MLPKKKKKKEWININSNNVADEIAEKSPVKQLLRNAG